MIDVDGYSQIERIGQGGVGIVYRAIRRSTGAPVAIKVLRDVSDASVAWHRTRRELTALVALAGHANVIQLLELLEIDQGSTRVPALVMEYAPGGSVADLMTRRDDSLPVGEAVLIGRQVALALVAAHALGIVHRDIKPQNLLIDAYGQVKLCDFGIAALTRTEGYRTRTSAWSMRYASPEDLDDEVEVGPASDVYSLGATLLHLVHGAPPTLKQRLAEWVPPTRDEPQSAALDHVLSACLQPDPSRRPSAAELVDRFEQLDRTLDQRHRSLGVAVPLLHVGGAPCDVAAERPRPVVAGVVRPSAGPILPPAVDASLGSDHDATLHRAGRRPPPRPVAAPAASRRWRPFAAALAVLVVVAVASVAASVLLSTGPDGPDAVGATPSSGQSVAAPTASVTSTAPVDRSAAMVVGETGEASETAVAGTASSVPDPTTRTPSPDPDRALEFVDRPEGLVEIDDPSLVWPFGEPGECLVQVPDAAELQPVPCDDPHDLQRVAVAELDPAVFPAAAPFDVVAVQAAVDAACSAAIEVFAGSTPDRRSIDVPVTRPSRATWQLGDRRYQCLLGVARQRIIGDAALDAAAGTTG